VGPDADSTLPAEDRESGQPPDRRPRTRCCLLKGCERLFRPQRAGQRYCSDEPTGGASMVELEGPGLVTA
jgi:hypothetical protein